ncbi:MAG: phosphatidylserine decarboxylase [Actinobacteria bacterium]|nr:phosphatidylserine decarboxylase [Actinomycetota bacterium]
MTTESSSFKLPEAQVWNGQDLQEKAQLFEDFDALVDEVDGRMSATTALVLAALSEVCNPLLTPNIGRGDFWRSYRDRTKALSAFFSEWLEYNPAPANPGFYIEHFDHLANTKAGARLTTEDEKFKKWFVRFLDLRGRWLSSTSSASTVDAWMAYKGTPEHPFDIDDYDVPTGGFKSFNQFFLRDIKPDLRPLCPLAADENVVVAPCDGGIFYLTHGDLAGSSYQLPGKSRDVFELAEAVPGYGESFVGGPLLDVLLWFTDYHHFHAPVSGKVIHQGQYEGSFNYDFDNLDPNNPYAPSLPAGSDRVGWYQRLGKHKRYVWVIRTESLGIVAMIAIGFWGVGSIVNAIADGDTVTKGQYMGHFGYGGSSIVLAFEPALDLQFALAGEQVLDPDNPLLIGVKQCLGKRTPKLKWGDDPADSARAGKR